MPNPLLNFAQIRGQYGGGRVENYGNVLEEIRQYDPGARVVQEETGGEGGGNVREYIVYDETKLPEYKGNWTTDTSAATAGPDRGLIDANATWQDDAYGEMTTNSNFAPQQAKLWEQLAPLVVSLAAPMAGTGLAAAGIGAAGGTAGVTGAAAGLNAAQIASGGQATLLSQLARKLPSLARQSQNGGFSLESIIPMVAQLAGNEIGIPGGYISAGTSLANLGRRKR